MLRAILIRKALLGCMSNTEKEIFEKQQEQLIGYGLKVAVLEKDYPDRQLFLELSNTIGVWPEECLLIESEREYVFAAKTAGMSVLGITRYNEQAALAGCLQQAGTFYVIESMQALSYQFLFRIHQRDQGEPWIILETNRCIVREITLQDLDALYEIYEGKGVSDYTEPPYAERTEEEAYTKAYIEHMYRFYEYGMWVVLEKASGKLIGRAGIENREVNNCLMQELGYVFDLEFQGKGYAWEVCLAIMKYADEELEIKRLNCFVFKENIRSVRLAEKLGFEYKEEIWMDGKKLEWYRWDSTNLKKVFDK